MNRLQIHKINLPDSFKSSISKFVDENQTKRTQELGISEIDFDDFSFSGSFFKKIKVKETFLNPFGKEECYEYDYYFSQAFNIYCINEKSYLVIMSPQRSLKYFYEYLHSIFKHGFYIDNHKLDLNKVINKLELNPNFKILKAKFNEVSLSTNSKANVEIISNLNAVKDFGIRFGQTHHQLCKVKMSYTFDKQNINMEISQNGSIQTDQESFNGRFIKEFIKLIYSV
jgi:hypothetical protein